MVVIGEQSCLSISIFFFLSTFRSPLVCDFHKLELSHFFSPDRPRHISKQQAIFVSPLRVADWLVMPEDLLICISFLALHQFHGLWASETGIYFTLFCFKDLAPS